MTILILGSLNEPNATIRIAAETKLQLTYNRSLSGKSDTALCSDQLPITLTFCRTVINVNADKTTYVHFNKANWAELTTYTENALENPTNKRFPSREQRERKRVLTDIKQSQIAFCSCRQNTKLSYFASQHQMDEIRSANPCDVRIQQINNLFSERKRTKWQTHNR